MDRAPDVLGPLVPAIAEAPPALCNLGHTIRIARGARRRRRNRGHDALLDACPRWRGRQQMRNLTSRFVALATASALIAGCSMQQASTPQASAALWQLPGAPIVFRLVPDERNPTGCSKYDWPLSRPHTFTETGDTASIISPGGISSNMTQTSPGVYAADYYKFGTVKHRAVVDAASSPKFAHYHRVGVLRLQLSFQWCSPIGQERRQNPNFKLSQCPCETSLCLGRKNSLARGK